MYRSVLSTVSAAILLVMAAESSAQTCATAPSCSELGYTNSVSQCIGSEMVYCPFDKTKVFCRQTKTCEELGYDKTTTQCSGKKTFVCPGDASKVSCDDGAMIGEIRLWAGSSVPKGWKICDGSSLSKTTYSELYNVIGKVFGGSSSYFYLPNFKGRVPVGVGYATNSSYTYSRGSKGGSEMVTLTLSQMPRHSHGYTGILGSGWPDGAGDRTSIGSKDSYPVTTQYNYQGSTQAHENRMPYLAVYYIIYTGMY